MQPKPRFTLALLLAIPLLAGCGTQTRSTTPAQDLGGGGSGSGTATDQARVANQLSLNTELIDDAVFDSPNPIDMGFSSTGGAALEDDDHGPGGRPPGGPPPGGMPPIRFWRQITHVDRDFAIAFSDTDATGRPTRALVTVNKTLTGTFNVQTVTRTDSTVQRSLVKKALEDHWLRKLTLHRVAARDDDEDEDSSRTVWRVATTTGVQVTSRGANTRIRSIQIESGALDTTIADPLAFVRLRSVLRFDPQDSVRVTVTTFANDDIVVLQTREGHRPFRSNGNGTYTAVLRARFLRGIHHLGVDALSHGSLFDGQAPYDSQAWILPYVLRPTLLADADD